MLYHYLKQGERSEAQELRLTTGLFFSVIAILKTVLRDILRSIFRLHKSLQKQHFLGLE